MHSHPIRSFLGLATLATIVAAAQGCVADRPSRNGVFNENQYIRKDFLVRPGPNGEPDPGWFMKATIVQTSTPNPFAVDPFDMFTGAENAGAIVRFGITSDKVELQDMRELSNSAEITAQETRTPSIVNAWPATNVDLKYRINLDGEKTNFYEENQELDWQVRQWVKLNFDKNDFSDVAALGTYQQAFLNQCGNTTDSSASLVPGSFMVDEANDYMQWTISVTVPVDVAGTANSADCLTAYGTVGQDFLRMGRTNVTMNVMYSMVRAKPVDPTAYTPLVLDEKDPIRHKYGPLEITNWSRDPQSGLQAARQIVMRYNPNQPINWYFAKGYPDDRKDMWTRPGGIVDQTNAIFQKAGATARLSIINYDDDKVLGDHAAAAPRMYGDIRYNFIRWESDLDTNSPFLAVTQFQPDLRTGEVISASINVASDVLKDFLAQRTSAYIEKVIGSDPFSDPPVDPNDPTKTLPTACTDGDTIPLVSAAVHKFIYGQSTLFQKMTQYLPPAPNGASPAGPSDYIYDHASDGGKSFYDAYYRLIPYITYADPTMNQFVSPEASVSTTALKRFQNAMHGETGFQATLSDIDHGQGVAALQISGGKDGMKAAYEAADGIRQAWQAHREYKALRQMPHSTMRGDTPDLISFPYLMNRAARHCQAGHWQTRDEWTTALVNSYYEQVVWHEFGHILGLDHNFMGSVDRPNWPVTKDASGKVLGYGKLSSSVMEYSQAVDDVYWNNGSASGQSTPTTGWLPYDQGAIGWVYGNNLSPTAVGPVAPPPATGTQVVGISGQVSPTAPWNDPYGFDGTTEKNFLYCGHQHLRYTPLCRMFDIGSTPSEITATDIEQYEWNYKWRNFRNYYKVWSDENYGTKVADILDDQRRFLSMWAFDWSNSEITDKLIRIGVQPPPDAVNSGLYYTQLENHFESEVAASEQMVAAFHEAIIQQGTGQRPYATVYDPYFGDVTQQGIAIDKALSFVNWLGLWPFDNYDQTQAEGFYGSAMTLGATLGATHPAQAWSTAASMLGEKGPWDAYPSFFPDAVALFAHDTQSPTFTGLGYAQMRDWIGGHAFGRIQDVLAYFQNVAAQYPAGVNGCADVQTCKYNPMTPQVNASDIGHSNPVTQAFVGPDNRRWTWVYFADRNEWFFVDQDRNPSSYLQVLTYNNDLNTLYDDGYGGIYGYQARIKYMLDAYYLYGGDTGTQ